MSGVVSNDETPHLVDSTDAPICPEALTRDAMSDGEFWEHVFGGGPEQEVFDPAEYEIPTAQYDPCPECGEQGPCAVDDQGRPMIHLVERADDE